MKIFFKKENLKRKCHLPSERRGGDLGSKIHISFSYPVEGYVIRTKPHNQQVTRRDSKTICLVPSLPIHL